MRKKEYIQRAKNLILNRVKFHSPVVFNSNIDRDILKNNGIDTNLPIFKFEKKLTKRLLKAFILAQKEEKFNIVFSYDSIGKMSENKLKKLKNYLVYSKYSSSRFIENLDKMNINYQSFSNFNTKFQQKYFTVNDKVLNANFDMFSLSKKENIDDVVVDYNEFVLNGNNVFVKFLNTTNLTKKIECEFNFPLKNGYYFFKKCEKCVIIENLTTKQKFYFNFDCKGAKFDFSAVNGLENSVFCCVNVKFSVNLKPKQLSYVFFNFGIKKFLPKNLNSAANFFDFSRKICFNTFDLKVKTKNDEFDNFFNNTLPKKIWLAWVNCQRSVVLEEKYKTYRKLFVSGKDEVTFNRFNEIGVREILIFNGTVYKKIYVICSDEKFVKIGKTTFFGTNCLSQKCLKDFQPISISFGR